MAKNTVSRRNGRNGNGKAVQGTTAPTDPNKAVVDALKQAPPESNDPLVIAFKDDDWTYTGKLARELEESAEGSTRKARQALVASILSAYAHDALVGASNPTTLYTTEGKFNAACAKEIARKVYGFGNSDKIDRKYEKAVRDISPIVLYSIRDRIPFTFDKETQCLLVPLWMTVTDKSLAESIKSGALPKAAISGPTPLDGMQGRNLATVLSYVPDNVVPTAKRDTTDTKTKEAKHRDELKTLGLNAILDLALEILAKMDDKPLSNDMMERIAAVIEQASARNGKPAIEKALTEAAA